MNLEEEKIPDEFPAGYFDVDLTSRRTFLQIMGASLALAGLTGCNDKPVDERIVPYVNPPQHIVPGRPLFFATAMPFKGYGKGVLVATREGRPIKIEGNPDHPSSLGATDIFMQASVLDLYDPDRAKTVQLAGNPNTWHAFFDALRPRLQKNPAGLRILSGPSTSPTIISLQQQLLKKYPQAKWYTYDPLDRVNTKQGSYLAFGRNLNTHYDFSKAQVILSLDSDFLFDEPDSIRYARQFIDRRRVRKDRMQMNRLYCIESTLSITGTMADHRKPIKPSELRAIAHSLLFPLPPGEGRPALSTVEGGESRASSNSPSDPFIKAILADLQQHRGSSIIIPGEPAPPEIHALAHHLNHQLGNVGQTVTYSEPIELQSQGSIHDLITDMTNWSCDTLLILDENPAYTFPEFISHLEIFSKNEKNLSAHLTLHDNETAFRCQWTLPESHYLESWSDIRAYDGTASIIQPTIQPLYETKSTVELLNQIIGNDLVTAYETVRNTWHGLPARGQNNFETWWSTALRKGIIEEAKSNLVSPQFASTSPSFESPNQNHGQVAHATLELAIRPDYTVLDGSFATNSWLQELPKPLTKLVWDNAALMNPNTAAKHKLFEEELVKFATDQDTFIAPIIFVPGVPEDTITIHLGYGRTRAGAVGTKDREKGGFDIYRARTAKSPWSAPIVQINKTGRKYNLVATRSHHGMDEIKNNLLNPDAVVTEKTSEAARDTANRKLIRNITLTQFQHNQSIVKELGGEKEKKPLISLYPGPDKTGWDYSHGYQWGMSIDTNACIGCNACVIACQSENNIPVVGKDECNRQREMHWIRIDSYYSGPGNNPEITHEPVPCMHCEQAPCEYVCPVGATSHSDEGLNQMTYNRCVGTRYCSNNCPYKVRRFNFFPFTDYEYENSPQRKLQRNPEVTVRTGGVMEKCSYCIQRVQLTRIDTESAIVKLEEQARDAKDENERTALLNKRNALEFQMIEDLQTACQQACPTQAIVFGSIRQVAGQTTKVASLKAEPLDYSLLYELNTKPRTTYMARLRNPNLALEQEAISVLSPQSSALKDGGAA